MFQIYSKRLVVSTRPKYEKNNAWNILKPPTSLSALPQVALPIPTPASCREASTWRPLECNDSCRPWIDALAKVCAAKSDHKTGSLITKWGVKLPKKGELNPQKNWLDEGKSTRKTCSFPMENSRFLQMFPSSSRGTRIWWKTRVSQHPPSLPRSLWGKFVHPAP